MGDHRGVQGAVPGGVDAPETRVRVPPPQPVLKPYNSSMKQSRRMSLVEAIANVLLGFGVALLTQVIVFPLFGLEVTLGENLAIGGLFTLASIARSYALRRVFEAIRARPLTKTDAATR